MKKKLGTRPAEKHRKIARTLKLKKPAEQIARRMKKRRRATSSNRRAAADAAVPLKHRNDRRVLREIRRRVKEPVFRLLVRSPRQQRGDRCRGIAAFSSACPVERGLPVLVEGGVGRPGVAQGVHNARKDRRWDAG